MALVISGTTSTAGITLTSANNPVFVTPGSYVFGTTATALYGGSSATWTITNSGQVNAVSFGISLKAGGTITNKASGGIFGGTDGILAGSGLTVSNAGYIGGANTIVGYGIKVSGAAVISNLATGTIVGGYGGVYLPAGSGVGSLTNAGTIKSLRFAGVAFNAGGSVTNMSTGTISGQLGLAINSTAGTVFNAGAIQGKGFGLIFNAGGTITNAAGGTIGGTAGVQITGASGTVTNMGTISGTSSNGVALGAGGVVANLDGGTITGGASGISVSGGAATVTNAGSIGGGSNAVLLAAGNANRVIVNPGGSFSGVVNGGNAIGAAAVSVLELATGGLPEGQVSGLGSQFVNFAQVSVDPAAIWTLAGTNMLAAGTTLTNSGLLRIFNGGLSDAGGIVNNGQIQDDGTLTVGTLTGTGQVLIGANSALTTSGTVATSETIVFTGAGGLLNLAPAGFSGIIQGFESGDAIELAGVSNTTSASIVNANTLVVGLAFGGPIDLVLAPDQVYSNLIFTIEAPSGSFGNNSFIAVTGPMGPTIINQGGSQTLTGSQATTLAGVAGGLGGITVSDANSLLTTTTNLFTIGDAGQGSLSIQSGGSVVTTPGTATGLPGAVIAAHSGAGGSSVTVTGADSGFQVAGPLLVGDGGAGFLSITTGGSTNTGSLDAGVSAGATGVITVYGIGSNITDGGQLTVGDAGAGELSITNGATVTAASADLGLQSGGSGVVDIEGSGSRLDVLGDLNVGDFGIGVLTVGEGSTLHVTGSQNVGASGVVNLLGGTIDPQDGTISNIVNVGGSGSSPGLLQYTGTVWLQGGTINATTGTADVWIGTFGTDMGNPGLLSVQTGANMVLADGTGGMNGPMVFSGATIDIAMNGKTGTITTLTVEDAAVLNSATITSFKATDTIELPNFYFVGKTIAVAGTVELLNSGGGVIGEVLYDPGFVNGTILEAHIFGAPCFAAGTRIATTRGEIAVESLRAGDQVLLARGGTAPVKWLGTRTVECSRHPQPWDVMPVRVAAHAFGTNQPSTDLMLSPDHAVFVDGVLIPIRYLLNGATVVQETAERITYWHVELEHHDVLLAEGLACESYLDTGNRGAFANSGGAGIMLHPDFALAIWQAEACAPLAVDGPAVLAARQRLTDRAAVLGWTRTADPDLRVLAGGQALEAMPDDEGLWFTLPEGAAAVRLLSRSMVPAHLFADAIDTRALGLAVTSVALDGMALALDDPRLVAGWHAPEPGLRWTDGAAVLHCAGAGLLTLHLAALPQFWVAPESVREAARKAA